MTNYRVCAILFFAIRELMISAERERNYAPTFDLMQVMLP